MRIDHENESRIRVIEQSIAALIAALPEESRNAVIDDLSGRIGQRLTEIGDVLDKPAVNRLPNQVLIKLPAERPDTESLKAERRQLAQKLNDMLDLIGR